MTPESFSQGIIILVLIIITELLSDDLELFCLEQVVIMAYKLLDPKIAGKTENMMIMILRNIEISFIQKLDACLVHIDQTQVAVFLVNNSYMTVQPVAERSFPKRYWQVNAMDFIQFSG